METQTINFPHMIYGTAWKREDTARLVKLAVKSGFVAIDTANQPRHYNELYVGNALAELKHEKNITREQLILQTKFTPLNSHDDSVPYSPTDTLTEQVQTSFYSSLEHLGTDYIDSYLLHGLYNWPSLGADDWEVWQAIENIYLSGKARCIGVSNFNVHQLALLMDKARIKPMIVQNRCFANRGWDKEVREFCRMHRIMYQGFSLLTANTAVLDSHPIKIMAHQYNKTAAQIIFRFALQIGIIPLTGTTNESHMEQDLNIDDFDLMENEVDSILNIVND